MNENSEAMEKPKPSQPPTGPSRRSTCNKNIRRIVKFASFPSKPELLLLMLLVLSMILRNCATSAYYSTSDSQLTSEMIGDYAESLARALSNFSKKRSCLRRGSLCDRRPRECCSSSVCRCNFWGSECRCDRKGLLHRWGRKKK